MRVCETIHSVNTSKKGTNRSGFRSKSHIEKRKKRKEREQQKLHLCVINFGKSSLEGEDCVLLREKEVYAEEEKITNQLGFVIKRCKTIIKVK